MHTLKTLAFAAAMVIAAPAMAQSETRGTLLSINAQGVSEAAPDMATITVGVLASGRTAHEAQAENSRQMQALIGALHEQGIEDRDVQTASISVSPQFARRDNRRAITGYLASNSIRVRVRDLAATGRILDVVAAAGGDMANGIVLSFQDPDAQLDAARQDAIADATRRAHLYAQALGMRVQRVIAVSEPGASEQLMLTATLTTDALLNELPQAMVALPSPPIAPGEIVTRVSVNVTFELR